ncbi:extracellular solute-binding protein [Clostridium tertium]|uniref:Lactose-binding protein n=1 Tax=Clostridium tertium TaxID=1559 RepID=A0A6N3D0F2_9CLOT
MKNRKKVSILLFVVFFIIIFFSTFFSKSNKSSLKGDIVVWTNEYYYDYFSNIANEFEESNKKVKIKVVEVSEDEYVSKIINSNETDLPNIVHLNFLEINLVKDKINLINENMNTIETYKNNFNVNRLKEVETENGYYGIPFTSNPISMYLREDILNSFGYKTEDINTWNQLIEMGKDINIKSNGEYNLFSSEDRLNIDLLLLTQFIEENEKYNKDELLKKISELYNEGNTTSEKYICRISGIDFYKELIDGETEGVWECKNHPSLNIGENRLFDLGGENLVALNAGKNSEVIKSFMAFASTNTELLSKEIIKMDFLPSSLYSLNVKINDGSNIKGSSPLLVLMNTIERAPAINNIDEFKKIVLEIINQKV